MCAVVLQNYVKWSFLVGVSVPRKQGRGMLGNSLQGYSTVNINRNRRERGERKKRKKKNLSLKD